MPFGATVTRLKLLAMALSSGIRRPNVPMARRADPRWFSAFRSADHPLWVIGIMTFGYPAHDAA
jgi:hypothetical protein